MIPGGGVALLHASKLLWHVSCDCIDEELGIRTLEKAIKMPFIIIANN